MTDEELIARLRDGKLTWGDRWNAANRIEALALERDEALNQLDSVRHSVDVLEGRVAMFMARLAKAVAALREMLDRDRCECPECSACRAVLAEIGGE